MHATGRRGLSPRPMHALEFLTEHGYLLLFLLVLAERIGLPLPAIPILLTAGALVRQGAMSWPASLFLAVGACLLADLTWYEIGRRRGGQVMRWLCRISLEPDSCVRKTEGIFERWGGRSLLVAKFLPPLGVAAVPMAGMLGLGLGRFLILDTAGSLLWVAAFLGLGFLCAAQLELLLQKLAEMGAVGAGLGGLLLGALAIYLAWKWMRRRRFLHDLRIARITPDELDAKIRAGEDVTIVDLRHRVELAADPRMLPGALHIPVEEFEDRHQELPRDRDVILYCT
jgi:membrane protein DedA with SNARE-associated domain